MIHAYDGLYLENAMRVMGQMLDYAVYDLRMDADDYMHQFVMSGIAEQFEAGNPKYIAGMSGEEVAGVVFCRMRNRYPEKTASAADGRSDMYWTGHALGYYQWETAESFARILADVPVGDMASMYGKYHEMDLRQFRDEINRRRRVFAYAHKLGLKQQRTRMGYSQSMLAERSGVPVRTIQQYEQGQKNINRAAAETVLRLARVLACDPEELLAVGETPMP